jgi:hypothetical protein
MVPTYISAKSEPSGAGLYAAVRFQPEVLPVSSRSRPPNR